MKPELRHVPDLRYKTPTQHPLAEDVLDRLAAHRSYLSSPQLAALGAVGYEHNLRAAAYRTGVSRPPGVTVGGIALRSVR
jgi:hypothetical protein